MIRKILFFVISILSFTLLQANKNLSEEAYKRAPSFTISKRTIDSALTDGTALLIMKFYGGGTTGNHKVRLGLNETEFQIKADSNGRSVKSITPGKYTLYFYVNNNYEEVTGTVDFKNQEVVEVTVRFMSSHQNYNVKKPVIYVYSDTEKEMEIKLDVNGKLGFTWPVYHEAWNFTATPEGKIKMNGNEFNYLFWESEMPEYALDKASKEGFLVATDTLLSFLENSLDKMGFTASEGADFITFWYPQMIKNEKNYIQFLFNESCDTYARLNISPMPDHVFRVGMVWCDANNSGEIPNPQQIPSVKREGTTVIEWGGMETDILFVEEN